MITLKDLINDYKNKDKGKYLIALIEERKLTIEISNLKRVELLSIAAEVIKKAADLYSLPEGVIIDRVESMIERSKR